MSIWTYVLFKHEVDRAFESGVVGKKANNEGYLSASKPDVPLSDLKFINPCHEYYRIVFESDSMLSRSELNNKFPAYTSGGFDIPEHLKDKIAYSIESIHFESWLSVDRWDNGKWCHTNRLVDFLHEYNALLKRDYFSMKEKLDSSKRKFRSEKSNNMRIVNEINARSAAINLKIGLLQSCNCTLIRNISTLTETACFQKVCDIQDKLDETKLDLGIAKEEVVDRDHTLTMKEGRLEDVARYTRRLEQILRKHGIPFQQWAINPAA